MSITVYGRPQGKGRPRYTTRGGRVMAYTPANTKVYEDKIRQAWKEQDGRAFGSSPIAMNLKAYYPIPSRAKRAERDAMLAGQVPVTDKPDLDNVLKSVMDALTGLAYEDDQQVNIISATRAYSDVPRIEADIIPII